MTSEKLKQIIQKYRENIYSSEKENPTDSAFAPMSYSTNEHIENIYIDSLVGRNIINQILWMCDQIDEMLLKDKTDKAMRWLGHIQGILWTTGIKTIDALREDNKEEEKC